MKFATALSTKTDATALVQDLVHQIHDSGVRRPDLAILFVHPQHVPQLADIVEAVRLGVAARHIIGCTGAGIIGGESEVERQPAVSLLVGEMPGVEVIPFHLAQEELEESIGPSYWHFQLQIAPDKKPNLLLLADPYTVPAVQLVQALGAAYPGAPVVGGLASGGQQAGENRLILDEQLHESGCVGVGLCGPISLQTVVAQGCRPIGEPLTITRADKNIIFELGGRPPLAVLQDIVSHLPQPDQQLARTALFLGRVINEYQEDFGRGDFLIRNLVGHDPQSGALAVGDWMRTGQTVQFQVRDAKTADEDLRQLLARQQQRDPERLPHGAVLFSCLGRGENMYGVPDHDLTTLHQFLGPVPTAGFFCNGEIGPVGGAPHVHGFTSVVGLFCDPPKPEAK